MRLKICGVMNFRDAEKLAELGIDFIGLNFTTTSRLRIDEKTGQNIAAALKGSPTKTVALFQDQPLGFIKNVTNSINPDYVQLHGNENDEFIAGIDRPVIKSVTPDQKSFSKLAEYYLLDRAERGRGPIIDTSLAAELVDRYPYRVFLAGGLTPENLDGILKKVKPYAVDIAGGVRTEDEIDFNKVKKVLEIVRRQPHDTR